MQKNLIVLLLLLLMVCALSAKTGMLGLSFGLSTDDCQTIMETQGLKQVGRENSKIIYQPTEKMLFNEVWLYFSGAENALDKWTVNYPNEADSLDIEHLVFEQMVELHGEKYKWDDFMEIYYWSLGNDAYAECGWNNGDDYYFVNYYK